MDRMIVWPGAIPLETDILNTERDAMDAIHALASALFGTTTTVNRLACTPTSPASLGVLVGQGELYQYMNRDDGAYSSLAADTTHLIVKQAINLGATILSTPAPVTAGYSINYLIEASFVEQDVNPVVLPYYNASNPAVAYSGPNNTGAAQPTMRRCSVSLTAKAGVPATTGSQTTPSADSGNVGIFVVTVAYGATTVTSGNISPVAGATVVPAGGILAALNAITYATRAEGKAGTVTAKIVSPDVMAQAVQGGSFLYAAASGTNTITASLAPAPASLTIGMEVILKAAATNTGAATLNLNGFGASAIQANGAALTSGMLVANRLYALIWDGTNWEVQAPTVGGVISSLLANPGYEIYSHGKIEQWGSGAHTDNTGAQPITFPTPFPNGVLNAVASNASSVGTPAAYHATGNYSTTGMTIRSTGTSGGAATSGTAFTWRAVGN